MDKTIIQARQVQVQRGVGDDLYWEALHKDCEAYIDGDGNLAWALDGRFGLFYPEQWRWTQSITQDVVGEILDYMDKRIEQLQQNQHDPFNATCLSEIEYIRNKLDNMLIRETMVRDRCEVAGGSKCVE